VDAFHLGPTKNGALLSACVNVPVGFGWGDIIAKGDYLEATGKCIWPHWRAAIEAIHNPSLPVPSGLTAEWAAAVGTCRTDGVGSKTCCQAHVKAEQTAIDLCGVYDSARFGKLPTDVPWPPVCASVAARFAPGKFVGDFANVGDRIAFGNKLCCP